uniref:BED-type domain-containing protein n=1 Tax=Leersia perrieri TaxID=77586 RepID=A0A0D9X7P5_9ORYZ
MPWGGGGAGRAISLVDFAMPMSHCFAMPKLDEFCYAYALLFLLCLRFCYANAQVRWILLYIYISFAMPKLDGWAGQRLQAGQKHRLQAGKAERLILMATQGDASSKRKAKSNDPGWKYGYWPVIGNRNLVECVLCGHRVNVGIKRLKEHIVGGYDDAIKCPKIQMIS